MSNLGAHINGQIVALEPRINSDVIVAWGVKNIIPIVMLFIGIGIIASARKGQIEPERDDDHQRPVGLCGDRRCSLVLRLRRQHRRLRLQGLTDAGPP